MSQLAELKIRMKSHVFNPYIFYSNKDAQKGVNMVGTLKVKLESWRFGKGGDPFFHSNTQTPQLPCIHMYSMQTKRA